MHLSLKSFIIKLTLFSIIAFAVLYVFQQTASVRFQSTFFWVIWLFFVVSTLLIHLALSKAAKKDPKKFVYYFMGTTAIKLFAYLFIILIYGLLDRDHAVGFIASFLIAYFLFSGFEVFTLIKYVKK